jgi:hypothetical protein
LVGLLSLRVGSVMVVGAGLGVEVEEFDSAQPTKTIRTTAIRNLDLISDLSPYDLAQSSPCFN